MRNIFYSSIIILGCGLVSVTNPATAGEAKDTATILQQMQKQLAAMQQQMADMQKQHAKEISSLKAEVKRLREQQAAASSQQAAPADELTNLRRLAQVEAAKSRSTEAKSPDTIFKAGNLGLQALNPEISVTGDMLTSYHHQEHTRKRYDADFRTLSLHIQSYLDPYTKFKSAIEAHPGEFELGEAYMTRFGVLNNVNITLGKFRQQFGVINRWHKHALDQTDFPLALREIFGEGGLNQTGASINWNMPRLWGSSQELILQVTDAENSRLFGNDAINTPVTLLRYRNFRDLSKNTYFEFGLTGLLGWNDDWQVRKNGALDTIHESHATRVYGADFCLRWEPTDRMRYRNLEWRTEFYLLDRDILTPDNSGTDTIDAWGAYTYVQAKLNRKLDIGMRLDYFAPDQKPYANLGDGLNPLAYTTDNPYRWGISPYLTWYQSPFVRYRLAYDHLDGQGMDEPEDRVTFQLIWAAGPHKHDRY